MWNGSIQTPTYLPCRSAPSISSSCFACRSAIGQRNCPRSLQRHHSEGQRRDCLLDFLFQHSCLSCLAATSLVVVDSSDCRHSLTYESTPICSWSLSSGNLCNSWRLILLQGLTLTTEQMIGSSCRDRMLPGYCLLRLGSHFGLRSLWLGPWLLLQIRLPRTAAPQS